MHAADIPPDEAHRLSALRATGLLDTPPEERFDRVTRVAQRYFGVPIALVSLIDTDRQWFKSKIGVDDDETPRDLAFCAHAILDDAVFTVDDATADERFADNPYVTGNPNVRFYAGAPIAAPDGSRLGTLCVIDRTPRTLTDEDAGVLADLASLVEAEVAATYLATVDELTGLANRRSFATAAETVIRLADRAEHWLAIGFVDLDGFKQINDDHGHEEGDRALRDMSRLLTMTFRSSDVVSRFGGDEFAVLVTLLEGPEGVQIAADRLRAMVTHDNETSDRPLPLRFSLGWALREPGSGLSVGELLAKADEAMYEVKRGGR